MFQWRTSGKERGQEHPRPGITLLPAERCCTCPDAELPSIGGESPQKVASISLNHAAEPTGSWGFPGATSLPLLLLEENTFSNPKPHPCHDAPSLPSHPGCGLLPPHGTWAPGRCGPREIKAAISLALHERSQSLAACEHLNASQGWRKNLLLRWF